MSVCGDLVTRRLPQSLRGHRCTQLSPLPPPLAHTAVPGQPQGIQLSFAHLLVFFGHPLVPVVEHIQPFGLALTQHLQGHLLQPGDRGEAGQHGDNHSTAPCPLQHPGSPPPGAKPGWDTLQSAGVLAAAWCCWKRLPPVKSPHQRSPSSNPPGSNLQCPHHVPEHPGELCPGTGAPGGRWSGEHRRS